METTFPSQRHLGWQLASGEVASACAVEPPPVDTEWLYSVATACQRLAGRTLEADRDRFLHAFKAFAEELPEPRSAGERFLLQQCVVSCAFRAGHQFHRVFHDRLQRVACRKSPFEGLGVFWPDSGSLRSDLMLWAADFLQAFERHHEWPLAARVRFALEQRTDDRPHATLLAREIGCSTTTLTKAFGDAYGMTMSEYTRRLRLRLAIAALRERDSKVAGVARDVGYVSTKNFYRALRQLTGLTPGAIRALSDAQVAQLLTSTLAEP